MGDKIENEEETTNDDLVGKAKGGIDACEAPERAGEQRLEVNVASPVLVGAADEVPSHIFAPAAADNWDTDTVVPGQEEGAILTFNPLAASETPVGAADVGGDADARGHSAAEREEVKAAPIQGEETGAGTHQGQVATTPPTQKEEAETAPPPTDTCPQRSPKAKPSDG